MFWSLKDIFEGNIISLFFIHMINMLEDELQKFKGRLQSIHF